MYNPIPVSLSKTLDDISQARLSSYKAFFLPNDNNELYGLYCWNEALSSCFMRLIGVVEVTLRNRIHLILSQHVAQSHPNQFTGNHNSNDWYNLVGLRGKSLDKVKEITHDKRWDALQRRNVYTAKAVPISPNSVISSMTFGFWAPILDLNLPWNSLLPQIIPNHRYANQPNHWNNAHVGQVYERIVRVRDIRNRVSHFEPLWKLKDIYEEKKQAPGVSINVEFTAPKNEDEALDRLNMLYKRVQQLLYWLSKERAADFEHSELHQTAQWMMTKEALSHFKQGYRASNARLGSFSKSWGMKLMLMERKPIHIYHKSKLVGRYYPTP